MPPVSVIFMVLNGMIMYALTEYDASWPALGKYALGILGAGVGIIAGWAKSPRDAKAARVAKQQVG